MSDYQKGYRAGRKRGRLDGIEQERARRDMTDGEFFDQAMLRLIPETFRAQGWKFGDDPVTTGADRAELAARIAKHAVQARRKNRP